MSFKKNDSERIFREFQKIANEKGLLDKKAEYTMPVNSLFKDNEYSEVDISEDLKKIAQEELYNLKSDDVMGKAHPDGSKKMPGLSKDEDLATVEDLEGTHKRMLALVEKEMKAKAGRVVSKVLKLADKLDAAGFSKWADKLDALSADLLADKVGSDEDMRALEDELGSLMKSLEGAKSELPAPLQGLMDSNSKQIRSHIQKLNQAWHNFDFAKAQEELIRLKTNLKNFSNWSSDLQGKVDMSSLSRASSAVERMLSEIALESSEPEMSMDKKDESPEQNKFLEEFRKEFEGEDDEEEMSMDKRDYSDNKYLNELREDFGDEPEKVMNKEVDPSTEARSKMLHIQRRVNHWINAMGLDPVKNEVPETGNPGDSETYETLEELFDLKAGRDFKNWDQLLRKLEQKGQSLAQ